MSSNKAIQGLQKQNDSIYQSLVTKGVQFDRVVISEGIDDTEQLKLLQEENSKLKELAKANKPVQIEKPKEEKKPVQTQVKTDKTEKSNESNKSKDDVELDDDEVEEPVKKFNIITNMEELKRAFFNGDLMVFEEQLKAHPFKFYKVEYKYNSDKDGAPDFSAKNLLKGFVRNFDDYRKYFMICFRCLKKQDESKYKYESVWIVNSTDKIQDIIGSVWEDFEFEETTDIVQFISRIKKLPESDDPVFIDGYTCIGESYVH